MPEPEEVEGVTMHEMFGMTTLSVYATPGSVAPLFVIPQSVADQMVAAGYTVVRADRLAALEAAALTEDPQPNGDD